MTDKTTDQDGAPERGALQPPPEWSLMEAVRRLGSACAGREVTLGEIVWAVGHLGDETETSVVFQVKDIDKINIVPLMMVADIAGNLAAEVN